LIDAHSDSPSILITNHTHTTKNIGNMVVKWTSDKDQFVLNHLLTDSSIKINNEVLDAMIQTWRMYQHSPFLPIPI
jgi:hypothetical protein